MTSLNDFSRQLGHSFTDESLLLLALTHRSWVAENEGRTSNERLEFLGDAVLSIAVAHCLYRDHPDLAEGELAKIRSEVVSGAALAGVAEQIGLGDHLFLGRGEQTSGGRHKPSILADALEAVLGAVYLDSDFPTVAALIEQLLAQRVGVAADNPGLDDHKTVLQEIAAHRFENMPAYKVTAEGPDHAKVFHAVVTLGQDVLGRGSGATKKEAEQASARSALEGL